MNHEFNLGDRVHYRSQSYTFTDGGDQYVQESRVVTDDTGTVVDTGSDEVFGTVYAVVWDNGPYGQVSPATGQTYTINEYPAEFLVLANTTGEVNE